MQVVEMRKPTPENVVRVLEALEAERQWQPIKTAPKDGTRFWALERGAMPQQYECYWQDDFPVWWGWQTVWDNEPAPTHWMPLPVPQAVSGKEGE